MTNKKLYECSCCGRLQDDVMIYRFKGTSKQLPYARKRKFDIILCDSCYSHLTHIQWLVYQYGNFDILYKFINDFCC